MLSIKGFDCHCIINGINKNEVMNLMQNVDLARKFIITYKDM